MEEIWKFIKVWSLVFIALSYCYFIPSRIPEGKLRLICVIPILYLFIILPWNLDTNLLRGPTTLYLVWLGNFNLLLFSFGKGPLSPKDRPVSFSNFLALACLPIKIKQTGKNSSNSSLESSERPPLHLAIKVLVLAILTIGCAHKEHIHPKLLLFCYCGYLYIGLEFTLLAVGVTTAKILNLKTEPVFNEPYFSASLQDFWGRRWNLMITNILRVTVYEPIRKWGQLPAVTATFVVSGIMHEIIFFYLMGMNPTWEVTLFFILHGFCIGLEIKVKKRVKGRWTLPLMVSRPLTIGFVMPTSFWLFFPPLIKGGFDEKTSREIVACLDYFSMQTTHQ
ncbi:hypothetical protein C5167_048098 [Papaver somniferum]|uniref:Wax synthase domain-containing protein n=1 Tax=Papaver somniferum TaxID=3469 RepID=A0A4Y7KKJ9_PAPSO|nr:probable long-chain-alcohol O-fatty-acyltransferase 5 [Papaver somniferum]RZC72618.1 hypothetical protein C5167_048098 [Papaver somniferum]